MASQFCTACGTPLGSDERFCTTCGAGLIPVSSTGTAGRRGIRFWRIVAGIVVVLSVGLGAVTLADRDHAADSPVKTADAPTTSEMVTSTTSTTTRPTTTTIRKQPTTTVATSTVTGLDQWIAVLASIPTSLAPEAVDAEITRVRSGIDRPTLLVKSDDYSSMRPGYWVVYAAGWQSAERATAYCRSTGRSVPDQCYAKFLSR